VKLIDTIFKYVPPPLGILVLVYGFVYNSNSCLIPYLVGPIPSSCPVILWPYVLGVILILLGAFLWTLLYLSSSHDGEPMKNVGSGQPPPHNLVSLSRSRTFI